MGSIHYMLQLQEQLNMQESYAKENLSKAQQVHECTYNKGAQL